MSAFSIGIVGGTGKLGTGLAKRLVRSGYAVLIGSRDVGRATAAADKLSRAAGSSVAASGTNADVARSADLVVITVPFGSHALVLAELKSVLQGKIVVDTTVPLAPSKPARVSLPNEGSVARFSQQFLGGGVRVVSAFQNVAAEVLGSEVTSIDCDVLISGDDPEARQVVVDIAKRMGMRGWHAGPIDNSAAAEALTSVLIFINRHYHTTAAGIQISANLGPNSNATQ